MTIVDSMREALELAQMKGITPTAIELGPSKWDLWRRYVAQYVEANHIYSNGNSSETFGGYPVHRMQAPGIRVG